MAEGQWAVRLLLPSLATSLLWSTLQPQIAGQLPKHACQLPAVLQEYLGSYVSDESGRLVFQEGLLVQVGGGGHWDSCLHCALP